VRKCNYKQRITIASTRVESNMPGYLCSKGIVTFASDVTSEMGRH
jgi:hypothetical protein